MDHDVPRRVAGGAFEPQSVLERVVIIDQHRLPGLHDRQHAVLEGAAVRRVLAAPVHLLPMREFPAGHYVARIGESRDPTPIVEPSVPADMVPVQMRAHHVVDILGLDSDACEIGEIRCVHPMKLGPRRALLVVAEAGVDQDRVLPSFDDESMKAEDEPAARRID